MLAAHRLVLTLSVLVWFAAPRSANADDAPRPAPSLQPPSAEPAPPPPGQAPVYVPVYPAPLSQQVQTTYVPQSVALSGPAEITDVEPGRAVPAGYTAVQRPRKHLLVGGLVTLGVTYSISAFTAALGQDSSEGSSNTLWAMWVPIAGPFIELGQSSSATADVLLVGLGAAQVAGAIMTYYGLTTTQTVYVRNDVVGSLSVGPMIAPRASGLALSGRF